MDECFALSLPKGKELHFNFNYSLARNDQQLKQFGNILNKSGIRFPASTSLLVLIGYTLYFTYALMLRLHEKRKTPAEDARRLAILCNH